MKGNILQYRKYIAVDVFGIPTVESLDNRYPYLSPDDLVRELGGDFIRWVDTEWQEVII